MNVRFRSVQFRQARFTCLVSQSRFLHHWFCWIDFVAIIVIIESFYFYKYVDKLD